MPSSVYIETSVISYLTARPSRDLVTAAHQQITVDWWALGRPVNRCFVSELVVEEARIGDAEAARRRIEVVGDLPRLEVTEQARNLATELIGALAVPASASADALHIAIAAAHGVEYLLTWNCRHIANARMRAMIERVLRGAGYHPPVLCTPEELMEP